MKYSERTVDSIRKEYNQYTYENVEQLAMFLQTWMANEHNNRQFLQLFQDMKKDKILPYQIAKSLLGHGIDWFAYGN